MVALLTAVVVVLMIIASRSILLSELQWHFERSSLLEGNINQIMLVSKYQNQRNLYNESIDLQSVDEHEFNLGRVISSDQSSIKGAFAFQNPFTRAATWTINAMRQVMQKPPLPTLQELENNQKLYNAFRLEHAHQYQKALDVYRILESQTTDNVLIATIQLHQGFCHAMLGNTQQATTFFELVKQTHAGKSMAWTAQQLLDHMSALQNERQQLSQRELPSLQKARKHVYLMECKIAMQILDSLLLTNNEQAEKLVLQGLCAEEKGQTKQAAQRYLKAVEAGKKSSVARQANRRLFLLSERAPDTLALKAASLQINAQLQDTLIQKFQDNTSSETPKLNLVELSPELATAAHAAIDAIMSIPKDNIAELSEPTPQPIQSNPVPEPVKRRTSNPQPKQTVIRQKNGIQLTGTIVSAPDAPIVLIKTLVGVVGIPRSEIDSTYIP